MKPCYIICYKISAVQFRNSDTCILYHFQYVSSAVHRWKDANISNGWSISYFRADRDVRVIRKVSPEGGNMRRKMNKSGRGQRAKTINNIEMEGSRGEPIMRDPGAPPVAAGRHQGSLAACRPNYRNAHLLCVPSVMIRLSSVIVGERWKWVGKQRTFRYAMDCECIQWSTIRFYQ